MKQTILLCGIWMVASLAVAQEAKKSEIELKISGKSQLWYEQSDGIGSSGVYGPTGDGKIKANNLYLTFDALYGDDMAALLKLDGADLVSREDETVSEKAVEEANYTWKHIGGSPVTLVLGKDEMPFGFDYDKWLTDPIVHNFEIDKVWGVNGKFDIAGLGWFGASTYYHRRHLDDNESVSEPDNELGDNYTAKLELNKIVENLVVELSYAREVYSDITTTDSTTGTASLSEKEDETRLSGGLLYKLGNWDLSAEYTGTSNRKGTEGYDPALLSFNVAGKLADKIKGYARYEKILEDAQDVVEEDFFLVGIQYSPVSKFDIALEYSNYNTSDYKDASDLKVADGTLDDSIKLGITTRF